MAARQQQFILRWHYHDTTIFQNLLRFLDGDILTDVTLSVGSRRVRAHKVILGMCSVYFLQLFQGMTTAHPVVILHNVSFEEIMGILSFIYRGQCIITEDQLPSFLAVAKLLKIQGLCDMKLPERDSRNDQVLAEDKPYRRDSKESSGSENLNKDHYVWQKYEKTVDKWKNKNEDVKIKQEVSTSNMKLGVNPEETVTLHQPVPPKSFFSIREPSETCKCFFCGKYLSNQYNLRVHMETHQEAYYPCHSCPHVSRSRDALRKHISYRHPQQFQTRKRKKIS